MFASTFHLSNMSDEARGKNITSCIAHLISKFFFEAEGDDTDPNVSHVAWPLSYITVIFWQHPTDGEVLISRPASDRTTGLKHIPILPHIFTI